jgi:hypothetical protein
MPWSIRTQAIVEDAPRHQ